MTIGDVRAVSDLSSYGELISVLDGLPLLLRENRRRKRLSLREAAIIIGCSAPTLMRIENGEGCHLSNAVAVLQWLAQP